MNLNDLEIYQMSRQISKESWEIYKTMDWQTKKIIGDQFITAADSMGANIAEGFGRYHYLDKNKFNYNARGSLMESIHWVEVLAERGIITRESSSSLIIKLQGLNVKLNNYIATTRKQVVTNSNKVEIKS